MAFSPAWLTVQRPREFVKKSVGKGYETAPNQTSLQVCLKNPLMCYQDATMMGAWQRNTVPTFTLTQPFSSGSSKRLNDGTAPLGRLSEIL